MKWKSMCDIMDNNNDNNKNEYFMENSYPSQSLIENDLNAQWTAMIIFSYVWLEVDDDNDNDNHN